jgi:hypothetical protein
VKWKGIANFRRSKGIARTKQRGKFAAPVLPEPQRKGPCARSLSDDLIFWFLFYQEKRNSPAAIERRMTL